jgi:hypothetical protein
MVQSKKRTVVSINKVKHDGQGRVHRAYRQLWRWALKAEKENKTNQPERKE